ncbi:hypothetical protein Q5Y75_12440 [Ruegeria sp. 2205SS24-7]|nr:hypothetical protein [Ruegeria sp. 2205SS24-7]MDP5218029.1 hypothetical protein [Ruegeria sp. 2205SS24-7]
MVQVINIGHGNLTVCFRAGILPIIGPERTPQTRFRLDARLEDVS